MILIIIVLVLIGALTSLVTVTWMKCDSDNEVEAMFNTIVVILLCILICKVFEC